MRTIRISTWMLGAWMLVSAGCSHARLDPGPAQRARRGIVVVVDAFRADILTPERAPHMWALAQKGTRFARHHSVFPCTTINNAGAIATGNYPQTSSWWGEKLYVPTAAGADAKGKTVDFTQVVEARDWGTLRALNEAFGGKMLATTTLFQAVKAAGLKTAVLGKAAATFLQDVDFPTYFLDPNTAAPKEFALDLQAAGFILPPNINVLYPDITPESVTPYAKVDPAYMADGVTTDPSSPASKPSQTGVYEYIVKEFVDYVLPVKQPDLSLIWINEPDASMHTYGVGSRQYLEALAVTDRLVQQIWDKVVELGWENSTDLLVVGDHGASTVSGDLAYFPLRSIEAAASEGKPTIGSIRADGYAFSGQAMLIEPLKRAGFDAFNGAGCAFDPYMTGVKADGSFVYPVLRDASLCSGKDYTNPGYRLPDPSALPSDAVILFEVAGSDLLYVPSHDVALVEQVVRLLQGRPEIDAIFVNSRYGDIPGTLSLREVLLENPNEPDRVPDIAVSLWTDGAVSVQGMPGIGYHNKSSTAGTRGDHGAIAEQDVHVAGFALGPDIREGWVDPVPTGNVDIAPTIARALHLDSAFGVADGRVLDEILRPNRVTGDKPEERYAIASSTLRPTVPATGLRTYLPTSPNGDEIDPSSTSFTERLDVTTVKIDHREYRYIDNAKGLRSGGATGLLP